MVSLVFRIEILLGVWCFGADNSHIIVAEPVIRIWIRDCLVMWAVHAVRKVLRLGHRSPLRFLFIKYAFLVVCQLVRFVPKQGRGRRV